MRNRHLHTGVHFINPFLHFFTFQVTLSLKNPKIIGDGDFLNILTFFFPLKHV